jgi:hypothetical protein
MVVPLAVKTWMAEAPGTTVGTVVVVAGAVVVVVLGRRGVCAAAVLTSTGGRVADGMSNTPMMKATTTTPMPRNQPVGDADPDGS